MQLRRQIPRSRCTTTTSSSRVWGRRMDSHSRGGVPCRQNEMRHLRNVILPP
ncbi:unnamed protein product [Periconia digitata]|uniref:Uncharacterized protein n=1 Tax=Periconia digitata TaxID=1303443 RepID=A0A9W4U6H5_9PLEO|nr:unnamed protein product [Periconia digitata]